MAFNWQTFRTRTLTAAIFVIVMLTGLLWNQWSFLILFSIIHFGCWWEYLRLMEKIYNSKIDSFIKYFFCVCGYLVFLAVGYNEYSYDFVITFSGIEFSLKWGLIILFIVSLFAFLLQNKQLPTKLKWACVLGFVYISLCWGLMIDMYYVILSRDGVSNDKILWKTFSIEEYFPIIIIGSIWVNDTMAYIVGSLMGKTPLSKISPKKTWEGTIGGVILSVIVIGILNLYLFDFKEISPFYHWFLIPAIAAIAGSFGDLLESKLKRMAEVKDSGRIMPGHGGFLDRFDSLLLATPFVWLYVKIFLNY